MKRNLNNGNRSWIRVSALALLFAFSSIVAFAFDNPMVGASRFGVTLSGPEFGQKQMPGVYGKDYIYPSEKEVAYYASKNINKFHLPVRWERIQRKLGGALDAIEVKRIKDFLNVCDKYDASVIINIQNYGRYTLNGVEVRLGSDTVTNANFRDLWKKMAAAFNSHPAVIGFNLMAEPHDLGSGKWFAAAQEAINGIREISSKQLILVDGDSWANAANWEKHSDILKNLVDPANKIVYNAHIYFDADHSGSYANSNDPNKKDKNIGVKKAMQFVEWLKKNNKIGYFGEFGIPSNDADWFPVLNNFLEYINKNNISASSWGAGPWWGNYPLSIEPVNNQDKPQLVAILKYANNNNAIVAKN